MFEHTDVAWAFTVHLRRITDDLDLEQGKEALHHRLAKVLPHSTPALRCHRGRPGAGGTLTMSLDW